MCMTFVGCHLPTHNENVNVKGMVFCIICLPVYLGHCDVGDRMEGVKSFVLRIYVFKIIYLSISKESQAIVKIIDTGTCTIINDLSDYKYMYIHEEGKCRIKVGK